MEQKASQGAEAPSCARCTVNKTPCSTTANASIPSSQTNHSAEPTSIGAFTCPCCTVTRELSMGCLLPWVAQRFLEESQPAQRSGGSAIPASRQSQLGHVGLPGCNDV